MIPTCESLRIGRRETCGALAVYQRIGGFGKDNPNALCDLCLKRIYRGFEIRIADYWQPITQPTKPNPSNPSNTPDLSDKSNLHQLTLL